MLYQEQINLKQAFVNFSSIQHINKLLSKFDYYQLVQKIYEYDQTFFIHYVEVSKTKKSLLNFIFNADNTLSDEFYKKVMLPYFKNNHITIGKTIYENVLGCTLSDRYKIKKYLPDYTRLDHVILMMYYQVNRPELELEHIAQQTMQVYLSKGIVK